MDVLSTKDGSAQAVRDAAASDVIDSRMALERELDRLNVAVGAHCDRVGAAPSVVGAGAGLPADVLPDRAGRRLVAAAARQALAARRHRRLRRRVAGPGTPVPAGQSRSHRAAAPEPAAGRAGARAHRSAARRVLARRTVIARSVGDWATTLMPIAVLAGWVALTLYTLTLPLPTDARAAAEVRGATRAAAASASATPTSAAPPRAQGVSAQRRRTPHRRRSLPRRPHPKRPAWRRCFVAPSMRRRPRHPWRPKRPKP